MDEKFDGCFNLDGAFAAESGSCCRNFVVSNWIDQPCHTQTQHCHLCRCSPGCNGAITSSRKARKLFHSTEAVR